MDAPTDLIFDLVKAEEIPDAIAIEEEGFPPDEAGTLEKFKFRQDQAPDLFLGAFIPRENGNREIIGYICSTLSPSETLTHDSMSMHIPNSPTVCVHSICVKKALRRRGIASKLMKEYISRLRVRAEAGSVPYERIVLIAHDDLVPFYESCGFKNLGRSEVVHGSLPWYEVRVDLKDKAAASSTTLSIPPTDLAAMPPAQQGNQQIPPGVWEALMKGSLSSNGPVGKLLSSFENGLVDVISGSTQGRSVNIFDLLCPRPGCGSVILKNGVAQWVERASEQLQPPEVPLNPLLAPLPPPGETTQWWLVSPSPMAFENIGFSKPVGGSGSKKKLLACAECDLGPLGWSEEGGTEFWLACSRVAYRV